MHSLSVIIPTHNRAHCIGRAVESVLQQSHPPGEVIVVDDGSTDTTRQTLLPFRHDIRVLRIPHSGVAQARNHGVAHSRSTWLAFLDSDDQWHPDKLKLQFEALTTTGHALCFCASVSEAGKPLDDLHPVGTPTPPAVETRPAGDPRYLAYPRHPFLQAMLVQRQWLLRAGGFAPWLAVAEDTRLIQHLTWMLPSTIVHQPLCTIHRPNHHAGLSAQPTLPTATIHYSHYAAVQAELLPLALRAGADATHTVHSQLQYFLSRLAEIELADGHHAAARRLACAALAGPPSLRRLLRCLTILACPRLASSRFSHKWLPLPHPPQPMPQAHSAYCSSAPADSAPACSPNCGSAAR